MPALSCTWGRVMEGPVGKRQHVTSIYKGPSDCCVQSQGHLEHLVSWLCGLRGEVDDGF